jgi:hypothetical protein
MPPSPWNRFQIDSARRCPASIRSRGASVLVLVLRSADGCSPTSVFPHPLSSGRCVCWWLLLSCSYSLAGSLDGRVGLIGKLGKSRRKTYRICHKIRMNRFGESIILNIAKPRTLCLGEYCLIPPGTSYCFCAICSLVGVSTANKKLGAKNHVNKRRPSKEKRRGRSRG